ncbi:MAG: hypothetical protein HQ478_15185 [Chloroflexi bacterium]|nr:hypothetical protein [Chloroflexota bacterium]
MQQFSPSDLGKWEEHFHQLIDGEKHSLSESGTWALADKPGLIAIFDGEEPVFLTGTKTIAKTLQSFHKSGTVNEFRNLVAIIECGLSPKNIEKKYKNGRTGQRVDTAVTSYTFSICPASATLLEALSAAFTAVADPRFNGPTAQANLAIDALPK